MASRHIKLEILLLSIIVVFLLSDYTLLLGHPSTRVGFITKNIVEKLRQRQARAAAGRSSTRSRRLGQFRHDSSIKLDKLTPSVEVRMSTFKLELLPRTWLVNTVRKMMLDTGLHDRTAESGMIRT